MIIYGQRTADDRIAFGGRGAPYHFGSAVRPSFDGTPSVHRLLRRTLIELFPALRSARFTHAWGGPLGIPRDWHSSVGLDRPRGLAWAGGYVGRRRRHDQPGRPDAGRPDHGRGHRAHRPSLGNHHSPTGSLSPCAGWASTPGSWP